MNALIFLSASNFICSAVGIIFLSKTPCKSIPILDASVNCSPVAGKIDPSVPASAYPEAFDKKNTPYNKDENLLGESLPTNERPIGDKHNSPKVCIR